MMRLRKPGPLVTPYFVVRDGKSFETLQFQCRKDCDWYDPDEWGLCNWRDVGRRGWCACDLAIIHALKRLIRQARAEIKYLEDSQ